MPRKTTIFIGVLAVITIVLVYLAVVNNAKIEQFVPTTVNKTTEPGNVSSSKPANKTAQIYFEPNEINIDPNMSATQSSDVSINAQSNQITAVQLEMTFDPKAITNISITPPADSSFFGAAGEYVVLKKDINYQTGTISYITAINMGGQPKSGIGKVATITFTPVWGQQQPSEIIFNSRTIATEKNVGESILKETTPLKINYTSQTVAPTQ